MPRSKLFYITLIFFFISLTTLSIVHFESSKIAAEASQMIPIEIISQGDNGEEQSQLPGFTNSSQENGTLLNSYLSTNISLGRGKPLSMAMDVKANLLYVVSPSENDSRVRNLIYVIDSNENKIVDIINIGNPNHDFLRDVAVDTNSGMIYATGEYRLEKSGVTYENDSIYFIEPKTKDYKRISVYYEPEEGKEGDLSEIAVDSGAKLVYVGSLYPEGGMPGLYVVDPVKNHVVSMIDKWESGVSEVLVDSKSHKVVATAKYDNLVSLLNESTHEISKNVTIEDPVSTSLDLEGSMIYVATGSGNISIINPISGEVTNNFAGMSLQDLSFNPYAKLLYITSVNKTMQLSSNNSGAIGKIMVMNPVTGIANDVYQSHSVLSKIISNPSSGAVYVLGYDDKNSRLFIFKPGLP
jgi:hypothetical protein